MLLLLSAVDDVAEDKDFRYLTALSSTHVQLEKEEETKNCNDVWWAKEIWALAAEACSAILSVIVEDG